jgi:hypothetical protein
LASAANNVTALIICHIVNTVPLLGGVSTLLDMKKGHPALRCVLLSDRYDALLCLCPARTMLLAGYVTTASGWVAA